MLNISHRHIPGSTITPSQTAFPSLDFGVLPWTYIGRHLEEKSHNTCACIHCKNVAKGLGHYEKQCLCLGPTLVLGIAVLFMNIQFIFILLIPRNVQLTVLSFFFFPVAARKLRASFLPTSSKFIPHACLCTDLNLGSFLSFQPLFPLCHIFFIFWTGSHLVWQAFMQCWM